MLAPRFRDDLSFRVNAVLMAEDFERRSPPTARSGRSDGVAMTTAAVVHEGDGAFFGQVARRDAAIAVAPRNRNGFAWQGKTRRFEAIEHLLSTREAIQTFPLRCGFRGVPAKARTVSREPARAEAHSL